MRLLYLQRSLSIVGHESLGGRKLFDQLRSISEDTLLGYAVVSNEEAGGFGTSVLKDDLIAMDLLKDLNPNLIFLEGGLFTDAFGDIRWRIPQGAAEQLVSNGTVMVVADVDVNQFSQYKDEYKAAAHFLRATAKYTRMDEKWPVQVADRVSSWEGIYEIICNPDKMVVADWLRPVYESVDEILIVGAARLKSTQAVLTSGNIGTAYFIGDDIQIDAWRELLRIEGVEPSSSDWCPVASVARLGYGYVVLIAGGVSHDIWLQRCPGNLLWLENLGRFLLNHASENRRRATSHLRSSDLLFLSHRSIDTGLVEQIASEIKRQGIAVWLDKEQLIPSDSLIGGINRALDRMTHFVLFWSRDCVGAPWVEKELNAAVAKLLEYDLRIILVRLDDTQPPSIVSDLVRIEAKGKTPPEIGGAIADSVRLLEHRQRAK